MAAKDGGRIEPEAPGGPTAQPPLGPENPAEYWMEASYKQQTRALRVLLGEIAPVSAPGSRGRNQRRGDRIGRVDPGENPHGQLDSGGSKRRSVTVTMLRLARSIF